MASPDTRRQPRLVELKEVRPAAAGSTALFLLLRVRSSPPSVPPAVEELTETAARAESAVRALARSGPLGASLAAEFRRPPPHPHSPGSVLLSTETPFKTTTWEFQVVERQDARWIPRLSVFFILPLNQLSVGQGIGKIKIRLGYWVSQTGTLSQGNWPVCVVYISVRYNREIVERYR